LSCSPRSISQQLDVMTSAALATARPLSGQAIAEGGCLMARKNTLDVQDVTLRDGMHWIGHAQPKATAPHSHSRRSFRLGSDQERPQGGN
jgi:hypothetical protein